MVPCSALLIVQPSSGNDKTQALSRPSRLYRHNSHPYTQDLNENVAASHVINNPSIDRSFPEDNSKAFQLARINAAILTLQNSIGKERLLGLLYDFPGAGSRDQ